MRSKWCLIEIIQGQPRLRLTSSYDPLFVEALKRAVPPADREWHERAQCWWVEPRHLTQLERLAKTFRVAERQEGSYTTDLHTGEVREQLDLFGL
jgi:hypothetical protein